MFTTNYIHKTNDNIRVISFITVLFRSVSFFSYLLSSSIFYDNLEVTYHLLCKWKGDYYAKKRTPPVDS